MNIIYIIIVMNNYNVIHPMFLANVAEPTVIGYKYTINNQCLLSYALMNINTIFFSISDLRKTYRQNALTYRQQTYYSIITRCV